ncbi:MAG: hypothetical protein ACM31I_02255 [Deltaproteobacteria bacterium]
MSTLFRQQAVGAGNGAEQIVGTGGSIVIPEGQKLQITDLLGTYQGAGIQRIREDNLVGAEITRVRYAADGTIIAGLGTPVEILGAPGGKTIVVTEEGAFVNSLTVVGVMEPMNA